MDETCGVGTWRIEVRARFSTTKDRNPGVSSSERAILIRMLNNLRALYLKRGDGRGLYALAITRGAFVELAHEEVQHARWMRHWN